MFPRGGKFPNCPMWFPSPHGTMKLSMKSLGQTMGELANKIEFERLCIKWPQLYKCLQKHVNRVGLEYGIINKMMTL